MEVKNIMKTYVKTNSTNMDIIPDQKLTVRDSNFSKKFVTLQIESEETAMIFNVKVDELQAAIQNAINTGNLY